MRRFFRLAMMLLLALALPVQGVAAAAMISCSAGQHDHGAPQVAGHHHPAAHAMAESHSADASPHVGHAHESHDGKGNLGKGTVHKCSACSSCCVGAAVPSPSIVFESVKLTDHFAPLVARSMPAYLTEGLERPPRAFLA